MPISQTEKLHQLIKTLSKSEKRHFKLFATRNQSSEDSLFLNLFDLMDKQKEPSTEATLKKLPQLSKTQYSNAKRHLYQQILTSLRLQHSRKNVSIQIREQLDYANILYGKGLYLQSLVLLERIEPIAEQHHQDLLHQLILEMRKLIESRHITRSRSIENKVEQLISESDWRNKVIYQSVQLSTFKLKMHTFYVEMGHAKNEEERTLVKQFFNDNFPEIDQEKLTFFEKIYLHQAHVWYYYILLDFPKCYRHATNWVEQFDRFPKMKEKDPGLYIRGFHYKLTATYHMASFSKFKTILKQFQNFIETNKAHFNKNQEISAFIYLNTSKLNNFFSEGNFDLALLEVPQIEKKLIEYKEHLDPHRFMIFYYKIALLYFGAKKYNDSLTYLNSIIDLQSKHLRKDIQCYTRLLQLLCHHELENFQLVDYQSKTVKRYYKNVGQIQTTPLLIVEFLSKTVYYNKKDFRLAVIDLKTKLDPILKQPFEKRGRVYLDIESWLESKITGNSLIEIIQNKYHSKN